jgi:hypothetical protein
VAELFGADDGPGDRRQPDGPQATTTTAARNAIAATSPGSFGLFATAHSV